MMLMLMMTMTVAVLYHLFLRTPYGTKRYTKDTGELAGLMPISFPLRLEKMEEGCDGVRQGPQILVYPYLFGAAPAASKSYEYWATLGSRIAL